MIPPAGLRELGSTLGRLFMYLQGLARIGT